MAISVSVSEIRSNHWAAYHSGEWAKLLGHAPYNQRLCYHIRFPNGDEDFWPVVDKLAGYEFR